MLKFRTIVYPLFAVLIVTACAGETTPERPELSGMDPAHRVEFHVQNDEYEEAFAFISDADLNQSLRDELLLVVHLTYAWELTHGEVTDQRNRMPAALRHLRRAQQLDPGNEQARQQIDLIEGIYRSMGREIPDGVAPDQVTLSL